MASGARRRLAVYLIAILLCLLPCKKAAAQQVAIRANAWSLALLTPELGVDVNTGEHTSLLFSAFGHYKPYGLNSKLWGLQGEFRYWFNGRPLIREYVGVTAFGASYDLTLNSHVFKGNALGVGFTGGGRLGDFRGYYKAQIVGKFEKPNFGASTPDGNALGFGKNAAGKPTFSVSIDNASADAVYGVYVCGTVDGDYVRDKNAVVSGSGAFKTFTVSADGADTQFVVIVAAEEESQLADHLADIEGLED